jgi:hypothetical protein
VTHPTAEGTPRSILATSVRFRPPIHPVPRRSRDGTRPHYQREIATMPRGDKSSYSSRQKRKAEHIEEGYEKRGVSRGEAARRAWATVNKEEGGGKKSGSGRGRKSTKVSSKKGGRKGGAASARRSKSARSAAARKGAATRRRRAGGSTRSKSSRKSSSRSRKR